MRLVRVPAVVLLAGVLLSACSFRGSVGDDSAPASTARSGSTTASSSTTGPAAVSSSRSSGSATSGSSDGSTTSSGAAVDRCHTSELTGHLVPGSPGAGQRYAALVLTDTGGRSCTVHGFGGLGLVDAGGHALPTRQVRSGPAPATVLLHPGGSATAQLHWGAVPGTGDATSGPCQPTPTTLRVIPPDETDALSVPWNQGPVCSGGTIEQRAYTG